MTQEQRDAIAEMTNIQMEAERSPEFGVTEVEFSVHWSSMAVFSDMCADDVTNADLAEVATDMLLEWLQDGNRLRPEQIVRWVTPSAWKATQA